MFMEINIIVVYSTIVTSNTKDLREKQHRILKDVYSS